jgi:hypothetical protein
VGGTAGLAVTAVAVPPAFRPEVGALLAEYVRRYAECRVPHPEVVAELWPESGRMLAGDLPLPFLAEGEIDLVAGLAPWGLHPVDVELDGVRVHDSAAHVELLRACLRLSPTGAGVFVVGMNFVANLRPHAVSAQLHHFGLHVEALLPLPRGLLYPESGLGRALVTIRRGPTRRPVLERLTRAPESIDAALERLTEPADQTAGPAGSRRQP